MLMNRRDLMSLTVGVPFLFAGAAVASVRQNSPMASVKALVFDTFGTVVDWRSSVAKEVEDLARRKGLSVDGAKFADAWRGGYAPSMNRVRTGELPWTRLDDLHG
jgi:2-haloacid dehalogenase